MSIIKGQVTSGASTIFPRNSLDNIVESVESSTKYITSGGKIQAEYLDIDVSPATEASAGIIQIATSAEVTSGADSTKAVVPSTLKTELDKKQDAITDGYRLTFTGNTLDVDRYMPIETVDVSGASPSVTIMAGHAYKINATNKQVIIETEPIASNEFGLEGHAEIFVAGTGNIKLGSNVYYATPLEPDSVNNCTIRFHDGKAIISVEDHVAGHVVTVNATSGVNTLNYWLAQPNDGDDASTQYISFNASLDGQILDIGGATTYNGEKHIVGNGFSNTILTGSINCTNKTTFSYLGINNIVVISGILTLGDVYIPSGSTVAVSGGGLAVEKVSGDGTINLNRNHIAYLSGMSASFSNVTLTSGGASTLNGGALSIYNANITLSGATITGNIGSRGGGIYANGNAGLLLLNASNCVISGNTIGGVDASGKDIYLGYAKMNFTSCTLGETTLDYGAGVNISGECFVERIREMTSSAGRNGSVTLSSGAILDLTGNTNATPIAPGGGITFEPGGATVQLGSSAGTVDSSYMMDNVTLPAGAKLTNTAVVDLVGAQNTECKGSVSGATIKSGFLLCRSGSVISSTTFTTAGIGYVSSGAAAYDCVISGGAIMTRAEGITNNTTVNSGGRLTVQSGGTTNEPVISSGGSLTVSSGGTALLVTSNTGAIVTVENGGYITYK